MKSMLAFAAVAAASMLSSPAQAIVLNYSLTGDYTATWKFNTEQLPADAQPGFGIIYDGIKGSYEAPLIDIAELCFFNDAIGGGIQLNTPGTFDGVVSLAGQQIYSGPESAPTFLTGTFAFLGYDVINEVVDPSRSYTLRVSVAPEPETWSILLLGFGLVGASMRRQKPALAHA